MFGLLSFKLDKGTPSYKVFVVTTEYGNLAIKVLNSHCKLPNYLIYKYSQLTKINHVTSMKLNIVNEDVVYVFSANYMNWLKLNQT